MREYFSFMKSDPALGRTWLILGKGPSFEKAKNDPALDSKYATVGLNHVCRELPVLIAHMIDANVLDEVDRWEERAGFILMPWQPHVGFRATVKTLADFASEHPVLKKFEAEDRLLWYNAWTGDSPREGSPRVLVQWFSAEAVVRMLAMAGVKKIRTAGIDGGASYSPSFKDIAPFRGGHSTFDHQKKPIEKTVAEFGIDYSPIG